MSNSKVGATFGPGADVSCPLCSWRFGAARPRIGWLALVKHYQLRHPDEPPPTAPGADRHE